MSNTIDSYVELSLLELEPQSQPTGAGDPGGLSRLNSRSSGGVSAAHHANALGMINLSSWSSGSFREASEMFGPGLGPPDFGPGLGPPAGLGPTGSGTGSGARPGLGGRKGTARFGQIADVPASEEDEKSAAVCRTTVKVCFRYRRCIVGSAHNRHTVDALYPAVGYVALSCCWITDTRV